ncbi:hypothetical protein COO60DRAFT_1515727 [Scenedesmus sp. NREL 46B-D3]|nr:hypothetical protein COO60DRAFT_1515727 [Scenedesmus sp. NREL 46B-D3]
MCYIMLVLILVLLPCWVAVLRSMLPITLRSPTAQQYTAAVLLRGSASTRGLAAQSCMGSQANLWKCPRKYPLSYIKTRSITSPCM